MRQDVLTKIVRACNAHDVDLDVSIHFNAGVGDSVGNGNTTGTEVFIFSTDSKAKIYAENICAAVSELGFRNRGVKISTSLYFLKKTKAPALLVECCFVDDKDDVQLYDCQKMAEAIVYGITGQKLTQAGGLDSAVDEDAEDIGAETAIGSGKSIYRVQVGAYSVRENAENAQKMLKAAGFDAIIVSA